MASLITSLSTLCPFRVVTRSVRGLLTLHEPTFAPADVERPKRGLASPTFSGASRSATGHKNADAMPASSSSSAASYLADGSA